MALKYVNRRGDVYDVLASGVRSDFRKKCVTLSEAYTRRRRNCGRGRPGVAPSRLYVYLGRPAKCESPADRLVGHDDLRWLILSRFLNRLTKDFVQFSAQTSQLSLVLLLCLNFRKFLLGAVVAPLQLFVGF